MLPDFSHPAADVREQALRERFDAAARSPAGLFSYPTGPAGLSALGYPADLLASLPAEVLACYCGVGDPFEPDTVRRGETILDVGCGAGVDAVVAARLAGSQGLVAGLEFSLAMVELEATATAIARIAKRADKPVVPCLLGRAHGGIGREVLRRAGLPCHVFPEPGLRCIEAMYAYAQWRQKPVPVYEPPRRDLDVARRIVESAMAEGRQEIAGFAARELLRAYGLATLDTILARSSRDAVEAARALGGAEGGAIALKLASPQIAHRSDVDGVALGLCGDDAVRLAFQTLTNRAARLRPESEVLGCLVQRMAPEGAQEVVMSLRRDEQFGPLLMFGLGGVHSQILGDVSHHLTPLSRDEAFGMIRSIRSYLLLKGLGGEPAANLRALEDALLALAALAQDFPQIYEAELDPVLVNGDGAFVAEARLTLRM